MKQRSLIPGLRRSRRRTPKSTDEIWAELASKAACSPHGTKKKREAELQAFAHEQLKREIEQRSSR